MRCNIRYGENDCYYPYISEGYPVDGDFGRVAQKPVFALINVVQDGDYQFKEEIPMGVGMIASYARQCEYPVTIYQCMPMYTASSSTW